MERAENAAKCMAWSSGICGVHSASGKRLAVVLESKVPVAATDLVVNFQNINFNILAHSGLRINL